MKRIAIITGALLVAAGVIWFAFNGGWLVLNILVVVVIIPAAVIAFLLRMLWRRLRRNRP